METKQMFVMRKEVQELMDNLMKTAQEQLERAEGLTLFEVEAAFSHLSAVIRRQVDHAMATIMAKEAAPKIAIPTPRIPKINGRG